MTATKLSQNKYWDCHCGPIQLNNAALGLPPFAPSVWVRGGGRGRRRSGKKEEGEKSDALISQSERDRFAVNGAIWGAAQGTAKGGHE